MPGRLSEIHVAFQLSHKRMTGPVESLLSEIYVVVSTRPGQRCGHGRFASLIPGGLCPPSHSHSHGRLCLPWPHLRPRLLSDRLLVMVSVGAVTLSMRKRLRSYVLLYRPEGVGAATPCKSLIVRWLYSTPVPTACFWVGSARHISITH